MKARRWHSSVICGLLLAACGDARDDAKQPEKPMTIGEFQLALVRSECTAQERCGVLAFADVDACYASQKASGSDPDSPKTILATHAKGAATFNPDLAKACLDAVKTRACADLDRAGIWRPECRAAFAGTVAAGGACISTIACKGKAICLPTTSASDDRCAATCVDVPATECQFSTECAADQVCTKTGVDSASGRVQRLCRKPLTPGQDGTDCSTSGTSGLCEDGLACLPTGSYLLCKPLPADGAVCTDRCAIGLVCAYDFNEDHSNCFKPKALGEACTATFECGGRVSNAICGQSGKCTLRPATGACPAPVIDACEPATAFCDLSGNTPKCLPFRATGERCLSDPECGPGSECVSPQAAPSKSCAPKTACAAP